MIITLTNDNFDQVVIKQDKPVVIEFYLPACYHCKKTEEGLLEVSEEYASDSVVAKCNAEDESALAARYDITTVPTLIFIKNGEIKEKLNGFTHKLIIAENIKKLR